MGRLAPTHRRPIIGVAKTRGGQEKNNVALFLLASLRPGALAFHFRTQRRGRPPSGRLAETRSDKGDEKHLL